MSLTFSQTEERVAAGSISFGLLTGPTTATTVREDGQIRLSASLSPLPSVLIAVENIVLSSPSKGNIQGSLEQAYSSPDVSGTLRVFSRVANLTRISGGPTLRRPATRNATTYGDLLRLMSQ
jgi:hypothetical protein